MRAEIEVASSWYPKLPLVLKICGLLWLLSCAPTTLIAAEPPAAAPSGLIAVTSQNTDASYAVAVNIQDDQSLDDSADDDDVDQDALTCITADGSQISVSLPPYFGSIPACIFNLPSCQKSSIQSPRAPPV